MQIKEQSNKDKNVGSSETRNEAEWLTDRIGFKRNVLGQRRWSMKRRTEEHRQFEME